jgi:hypothetical protein
MRFQDRGHTENARALEDIGQFGGSESNDDDDEFVFVFLLWIEQI